MKAISYSHFTCKTKKKFTKVSPENGRKNGKKLFHRISAVAMITELNFKLV